MATITSKKVVDELLELINQNEKFYNNTLIHAIVEFKNSMNETVWGITWPHDPDKNRYMTHTPPFVNHPKILWCLSRELISTKK